MVKLISECVRYPARQLQGSTIDRVSDGATLSLLRITCIGKRLNLVLQGHLLVDMLELLAPSSCGIWSN